MLFEGCLNDSHCFVLLTAEDLDLLQVVKQQPKKPSNDTNALLHQPGSARRSRQVSKQHCC